MPKKTKGTKGLENLVLITQVGINTATPILLSIYIGKKLDDYFNKSPLFLLIFIVIGIISSFLNLFKLVEYNSGKKRK